MKKEFLVADLIALKWQDNYVDLHNCFDLSYYEFNSENGNILTIKFIKTYECANVPNEIGLLFSNVRQLKVKGLFTEYVNSIQMIGYKDLNDDDMSWLIPEELSTENQSIVFFFDDDAYIKVFCDFITIIKDSTN